MKKIIEKIKAKTATARENPLAFIGRQLYRVFLIYPFQLIVTPIVLFFMRNKPNGQTKAERCFIITSVIYTKEGIIQYNSPRTIFTPEKRAEQTVQTVQSIRQYAPGAKIILVESGMKEDLPFDLAKIVDQYIYVGNDRLVRWGCDSIYKSLGEIMMLLRALGRFTIQADFYFKISGRYYLNEEFDLSKWNQGDFVFQFIKENYICTRLYGFRATALNRWKKTLLNGILLTRIGYPIENILADYVPKKYVQRIIRLGVMGIGGSSNEIIRD
jgi:hypothetical protein